MAERLNLKWLCASSVAAEFQIIFVNLLSKLIWNAQTNRPMAIFHVVSVNLLGENTS